MKRGATPTHSFSVGRDLTDATVYITYQQFGENAIEKTNGSLTITEDTITVQLTQEETLALSPGTVSIQIRYVDADGNTDASDIMTTTVDRILKDEVI